MALLHTLQLADFKNQVFTYQALDQTFFTARLQNFSDRKLLVVGFASPYREMTSRLVFYGGTQPAYACC